ncbi:hypothetical protein [Niallia taxi]|uniref:hypothetical protein n=1 Tax=Niallia taxi TaxID=2499688 RepID=UPI0015F439E1|nr:hypothetical protein [Niallia taxi]
MKETSQIQMKFFYKLHQRVHEHFNTYMNAISQNLAFLCLTAEEEGIPFKLHQYNTLADLVSDYPGKAKGTLKSILMLSDSVEAFFVQTTHDWLVIEIKETLSELLEVNPYQLNTWFKEETDLVEDTLEESFEEDPIFIVFGMLEHKEIEQYVHKELTEELLKKVYPMQLQFLYKTGIRNYEKSFA